MLKSSSKPRFPHLALERDSGLDREEAVELMLDAVKTSARHEGRI